MLLGLQTEAARCDFITKTATATRVPSPNCVFLTEASIAIFFQIIITGVSYVQIQQKHLSSSSSSVVVTTTIIIISSSSRNIITIIITTIVSIIVISSSSNGSNSVNMCRLDLIRKALKALRLLVFVHVFAIMHHIRKGFESMTYNAFL